MPSAAYNSLLKALFPLQGTLKLIQKKDITSTASWRDDDFTEKITSAAFIRLRLCSFLANNVIFGNN